MDEEKKDMPSMDCGCQCEKCMSGMHNECPTGMCQKKDQGSSDGSSTPA